jgi:hypothetical protein
MNRIDKMFALHASKHNNPDHPDALCVLDVFAVKVCILLTLNGKTLPTKVVNNFILLSS